MTETESASANQALSTPLPESTPCAQVEAVPSEPSEISDPQRCQFFFADGRQCAMPIWEPDGEVCLMHARQWQQTAGADAVGKQLATPSGSFKTANDINHALGNLFSLLAKKQIPRQDAAVLAYIGQLLLQSLSPMKHEFQRAFGWKALDAAITDALRAEETLE